MNEIQRKSYLEAMGLEAYYARNHLPFAAACAELDFPEDAVNESVDCLGDSGPKPREPSRALADIRESLQPDRNTRAAPTAASESLTKSAAPIPPPTDEREALRFTVQFYALGGTLAILSEQPFDAVSGEARTQEQVQLLLRNILLALGGENTELRVETFTWPLQFDAATATQALTAGEAKAAAASALNGYLMQKSEQHGFSQLLAFTGVTEPLLEGIKENSEAASFELTLTSNLYAILAVPSLKRSVWEEIKGLREALATEERAV